MRYAIIIAITALSPLPALAEDTPKPYPATKAECVELLGALRTLTTFESVVGGRAVTLSFKMGDSRVAVANNITALVPIQEGLQAAQQALVKDIGNGEPIIQYKKNDKGDQDAKLGETEEWKAYSQRIEALLKEPCPVTPARLKVSDFKANDDNPINVMALGIILKIADK